MMMTSILAAVGVISVANKIMNGGNKQNMDPAARIPLVELANSQSISWFQQKLQDACDMLDKGRHTPSERILVTNKEAREFREKCLRSDYEVNGRERHFTSAETFKRVTLKDECFNCSYSVNIMVGFRNDNGTVIPVPEVLPATTMIRNAKWSSYDDAFWAHHDVVNQHAQISNTLDNPNKYEFERAWNRISALQEEIEKLQAENNKHRKPAAPAPAPGTISADDVAAIRKVVIDVIKEAPAKSFEEVFGEEDDDLL